MLCFFYIKKIQVQDILDSRMDKRRKGVFGPPSGQQYIVYVDDMNMPQKETYGAQPPIELLRQWMDHKGWFELKPPCPFRNIIDTQFIASMGPPGGGRNSVTNRLLRHFNYLAFAEMSDLTVGTIFQTILGSFVSSKNLPEDVRESVGTIVQSSILVYNTIRLVSLYP